MFPFRESSSQRIGRLCP